MKPQKPTEEGIVRIGHFTYGHVLPVVELGQEVKPGQLIAWTTDTEWHLHLSEWRFPGGIPNQNRQIQVNPLDPEGKIAPYRDTAPPVIREIRFHRPVDSAGGPDMDRPSSLPAAPSSTRAGSLAWSTSAPGSRTSSPSEAGGAMSPSSRPTTIRLASTSTSTGRMTGSASSTATSSRPAVARPQRSSPESDLHLPPLRAGYAAKPPANTALTLGRQGRGELWFRLFAGPRRKSPYWNTTAFRDGPFRLTVTAWDIVGNRAAESIDVIVANNV